MNASTVSLILSILFAVFILWGVVWGLIRGLKNTLYRGAFLVLVMFLAFFLATVITNLILNLKIGGALGLEVGGVQAETLKEYATMYLQNELQISADATGAINAISALVGIVLNAIIFVLLFWLFKWILSPVYSILRRFVFDRNKYKKEEVQTKNGKTKVKKIKIKRKKHRLLGGLVGVVLGLIVCTFTFVPVLGYLNIFREVETGTKEGETGVVSNLLGADTYNAISDGYDKSVLGGALKYTGMEYISTLMFDSLTTTKVDDTKVSLNKEVDTGIEVYNLVKDTKMPDLNTCTEEELDTFLTNARQLINVTFKSGIINSSLDGFMPLIVDYLQQQDMIEDLGQYEEILVINMLVSLSDYHSEEIKTELLAVISLIETINDHGLLLPVVQNSTGDIVPFLQATTNRTVVNDITEKLFALKTVDTVAPDLVNLLLNFVSTSLEIEGEEVEEITSQQLKTSLQNILYNMVDLLQEVDMDSDFYVKTSGISWVGKVIDSIKNADFVSESMFDAIIDKVQDTLHEQIASVPAWAQNVANEAIDNLSNIENYTSEFEKIYTIVSTVEEACKLPDGSTTSDIAEIDFKKIGVAVDKLEELVLISRENVEQGEPNNLVKELLIDLIDEYTQDDSLNTQISTFTSISKVKENIKESNNINWSDDLPKLQSMIVNAKNLMLEEGSIQDKLLDESRKNDFVVLGRALDEAKTASIFANGNVDRLFMNDVLDLVDDSFKEDADMLDAINSIKSNISTASSISWEGEFGCIVDLINIDFANILEENPEAEKSQAYIAGEKLDNIVGTSVLINEEMVDKFIRTVVSDNFKDSSYESITGKLLENFNDIDKDSTNGYQNGIDSYAVEFDALNNLYQAYLLVSDPDFNLSADAEELGNKIETAIKTSVVIGDLIQSTTLVNEELVDVFITDIIDEKFDESDETFADTLADIKSKFSDMDNLTDGYQNGVESYTVEIIALSKMEVIVNKAKAPDFEFKEDGRELGRDLDDAVNTQYTFAGKTYHTQVVTEELVDKYVRELIDDNIPSDDGDIGPTISAIKSKFSDIEGISGYQNSINYYEVEFDALTRLLDVVDFVGSADFDGNVADDRLALATKLDSAMASVDIGTIENPNLQKAFSVTPSTLNPYIKTKISFEIDGDYQSITSDVIQNIMSYLDEMESDNLKTYTECFSAINSLDAIVDSITSLTSGNTWFSKDILASVEGNVDSIQNNILGGAILGRKVMIIVLEKIDTYCAQNMTSEVYNDNMKYILAYKQYLNAQNTAIIEDFEPYTSETEAKKTEIVDTEEVEFNINKPLQFIYEKFVPAV